jgi:predicted DNA-binding transcriptional regulator AlpA
MPQPVRSDAPGSQAPIPLPPRLLRTEEAARWLGLSGRTLEKHRCSGTGPAYRKLGGRVVYVLTDLEAWIDAGARRSTAHRGLPAPRSAHRRIAAPPRTELG